MPYGQDDGLYQLDHGIRLDGRLKLSHHPLEAVYVGREPLRQLEGIHRGKDVVARSAEEFPLEHLLDDGGHAGVGQVAGGRRASRHRGLVSAEAAGGAAGAGGGGRDGRQSRGRVLCRIVRDKEITFGELGDEGDG